MMHPSDRLNLHQLAVFQAVARRLSFSRAAEELNLSQPAVSMHVKQLERALGLELFEKVGRRITLTDAGRHLLEYSERIFALIEETLQSMEEVKGVQRGNLRVAADTTAGVYVVPDYLGAFRRAYPGVSISLDVGNRAAVTRRLLLSEVDIAVMGQVPPDGDLVGEPFLPNELVVVAPPSHRLAHRSSIPVAELAGEPFLLREPGSGTRAAAERFFAAAGVPLTVAMELGSNSAIKRAVANELGIAVISRQAVSLEVEAGILTILDVEGFPILRHWHVVHRRSRRLSPAAQAFKELLLNGTAVRDGTRPGSTPPSAPRRPSGRQPRRTDRERPPSP